MSKNSSKVTVAQIAQIAGVSPATVSRALNQKGIVKGDTYEKVWKAIDESGYEIPENTHKKPHRNGFILLNLPSLNNPFYGELVSGAKISASRHGYTLLINEDYINQNTLDSILYLIKQINVAGIITLNHIETDCLKKLAATTEVVQCSEFNEALDLPYVSINDYTATKNAIRHLLSLGRRRIAIINGSLQYQCSNIRLKSYKETLEDNGITISPELIIQMPDNQGDLVISAVSQLLSLSPPPDAFFCATDVFAQAALYACHLCNISVPDQVSIVGFDNLESSKMLIPSLTTINQPKNQLGFTAVEILAERLANPHVPSKKIFLETELIIRESSIPSKPYIK